MSIPIVSTTPIILGMLTDDRISSSLPVRPLDALATTVNNIQSTGEILIPFQHFGAFGYRLTCSYSGAPAGQSDYQIKILTFPKYSTHDRIWNLNFYATGGVYAASLSCSINGTQYFSLPIRGPGNKSFSIRETITGSFTQTGSYDTINIRLTGVATNTATISLVSYNAFELSRPFLKTTNDANNLDNAIDPTYLAALSPISDYDDTGTSGPRQLAIAISSSRNALKQAGIFTHGLPFTSSFKPTNYDSFWSISGSGQRPFNATSIPISLRHLYQDPQFNQTGSTISINVFGWCSGAANTMATASIVFKTDTGQSVTLTANGGLQSGSWYQTSMAIVPTNPTSSLPYALGANKMNFMQITGTLSSGAGTFVVGTIMFGEKNPC